MDRLALHTVHRPEPAALPAPQAGMPPETPAAMPEQSLFRFDKRSRRAFADPARSRSPAAPRVVVFGGAGLMSAVACYEMFEVLNVGGLTPLEAVVLVLFTVNFAWIALTAVAAIAGFAARLYRRNHPAERLTGRVAGRTAVLMPIYNEGPERVFAAMEAMAAGVARTDAGPFDWFLLSDTTDPEIAVEEESAFVELRERLAGTAHVYYRRRRRNEARKAGNIADFCRRWGGAYDYLLVLDADSLLEPSAIVELARRMEADPDAGIIQTVPRLVHGVTLLARLQQFAGRIYGPVIATGLGWWSRSEGNYWGHNAIIRRQAFCEAAGLPDLPGKPPFGGHILSHDFVEAALIRRAGWTVTLADDIGSSYEESPPSIVDLAVRDRRWCQGNLQHARLLGTRGLHWVSRFHLLTGIMSYLASPAWLLLIVAGLGLALQAQFIRPEYFTDAFQLHPTWPAIDPVRALRLLGVTAFILFLPKFLGLTLALTDRATRRACGGGLALAVSFVTEIVISALIAPIMMVIQTGVVLSILSGFDAGWKPQRRDDGGVSFGGLVRRHRSHEAGGVILGVSAWLVSPAMFLWLLPAVAGLLLAVPLSALTASRRVGRAFQRAGILRIPEESSEPQVGLIAVGLRDLYRSASTSLGGLPLLFKDERRRRIHVALIDRVPDRARGAIDPTEAVAFAKMAEAQSPDEALTFLTKAETAFVLASPDLFECLVEAGHGMPAAERGRSAA
jgi:membrane glycosyltransferase